jgi:hypothetical protein
MQFLALIANKRMEFSLQAPQPPNPPPPSITEREDSHSSNSSSSSLPLEPDLSARQRESELRGR